MVSFNVIILKNTNLNNNKTTAGFMAKSKDECIELATRTALPTHDRPEGIKGAVTTALAIYYGMEGRDTNAYEEDFEQYRINRMQGSETVVLGSQQYTRKDGKGKADVFANAIRHDHKSPNPTTRWSDIIKLK